MLALIELSLNIEFTNWMFADIHFTEYHFSLGIQSVNFVRIVLSIFSNKEIPIIANLLYHILPKILFRLL